MEKRGRFLAIKVFFIFVIITAWAALIAYEQLPKILRPEIAGRIIEVYNSNPGLLRILFHIRAILISLIPLTVLFIFIKLFVLVDNKGIEKIDVKKMKKKNETELDVLYKIVQEKKEIKIASIAKLFEIDRDLAMEWAKILEASELINIDYPGFKGPVIRIKTSNEEQPEEKIKESEDNNKKEFSTEEREKSQGIRIPKNEEISVKKDTKKEINKNPDKKITKKLDKKEINLHKKISKQKKKDEKIYNKALKKAKKKIRKETKSQNKKR